MTTDLGLVAHTADGDAHERTTQCPRDRLTQRRLADAGRTDQREDRTGTATALGTQTALAPQHAHRQELEDAVLDVGESFVVGVEHTASICDVAGLGRHFAPRQFDHRVEPVADPRLLRVLLAHALQAVELLVDREQHRVGQLLLGELGAVLGDDVVVALAQLLADLVQLAAQQQLALLLVEAVGDVGTDLVLQLEIGERLAHPAQHELEARFDVDGLQQLDALVHRVVGRVRGRVGQLARVFHAGEHVGDPARTAVLQDRLDDRAVLASELAGTRGGGLLVDLLDVDVQGAVRAELTVADPTAADAPDHEGTGPVGKVSGTFNGCDRPDASEPTVDARHEHDPVAGIGGRRARPLRLVRLERDRDHHLRQHDALSEGQQGQELSLGV